MKIKSVLMVLIVSVCFGACNQAEKKADAPGTETVVEQPKKDKTVVVARVKVKDGKAEDFLKIALPLVDATHGEDGNLFYEVYRSPRDSNIFLFYEEYANDSAFDVHANSEHFKKFAAAVPEIIAEEMTVDRF